MVKAASSNFVVLILSPLYELCAMLLLQGMSYDETLNIRRSNLNPVVSTVTYYKQPLLIHQVRQCSFTDILCCHGYVIM